VEALEQLLEHDTAGDPISGLRWSRRTTGTIATLLTQHGWRISSNTVARLLHHLDYSLHVNRKQVATTFSPDRNQQFEYIAELRDRFQRRHWPIISVDTKKRELVGHFKNAGARWDRQPWPVNDHDFRSDARGIAIPYGIYDPLGHRGSVIVGVSHNTPTFAAHAVAHWWRREGRVHYAPARELLILADTGGSNGYRCAAWKTELHTQLATGFNLRVTVAHYPTGASKWNPIEHRLFSEISKNWAGEPLDSYEKVLKFIRTTKTQTGLTVSAHLDRRHYPTGIRPTPEQLRRLRLRPHDTLPRWNYTILPTL
jgi:DDE family transposase